jgi:hypothetical protein
MKKTILIVFLLAVAVSAAVFAQAGPPPRQTYPAEVRVSGGSGVYSRSETYVVLAYDEENALRVARQNFASPGNNNSRYGFLRWISTEEYERMDFGYPDGGTRTMRNGGATASYYIRARYFFDKRNYARARTDLNRAFRIDGLWGRRGQYRQAAEALDAELRRLGY